MSHDPAPDPERKVRPPLTIRAGARPFETVVMSGGLLGGLTGVFDVDTQSRAIIAVFGEAAPWWCLSLAIWCGLVLASVIPQAYSAAQRGWSTLVHPRGEAKLATRLRLEQAGMIGFSGSAAAYGIAVLMTTGQPATQAAIWVGLFGVGALWRAGEIFIDLRKMRFARDDPHPAYPIPLGDPGGDRR